MEQPDLQKVYDKMTYQEKIIDKADNQIGGRWYGRSTVTSNFLIGSNTWWHIYKTEFIEKIEEKINELKIYCEVVDDNGNLFLTTKGSKHIELTGLMDSFDLSFMDSFDLSFNINFKLRITDIKSYKVNPKKFNILCEGIEEGDISLIYTTNLYENDRIILRHENPKDLELQYKFCFDRDYTKMHSAEGKGNVRVYYVIPITYDPQIRETWYI